MTPETTYKKKIKKYLKLYGIYEIPYAASKFGISGVPDTLCCINGLFLGIEFKANNGKEDPLQEVHIRKINAAGGMAFFLYPSGEKTFKELILFLINKEYLIEEVRQCIYHIPELAVTRFALKSINGVIWIK